MVSISGWKNKILKPPVIEKIEKYFHANYNDYEILRAIFKRKKKAIL